MATGTTLRAPISKGTPLCRAASAMPHASTIRMGLALPCRPRTSPVCQAARDSIQTRYARHKPGIFKFVVVNHCDSDSECDNPM
jgi:hypothetical protein